MLLPRPYRVGFMRAGPQFSREYSRLFGAPATSGCGADPVAASASRIVKAEYAGFVAITSLEMTQLTLDERQLAATI